MADNGNDTGIFVYTGQDRSEIPRNIVSVRVDAEVIRKETFSYFQSLETVQLTTKTRVIESGAFSYCPLLKSVTMVKHQEVEGDDNTDHAPDTSDEEDQNGVSQLVSIGASAFFDCRCLVDFMDFPPSLKVIGSSAFEYTKLETIIFPQGSLLDDCGFLCFLSMTSLVFLDLSACTKLDTIPCHFLCGCCSLKYLQLPPNLIEIQYKAFENCSALEELQLPDSLRKIGFMVFYSCKSLTKLSFPPGIDIPPLKRRPCGVGMRSEPIQGMCGGCDKLAVVEFASLADFGKSVFQHDFYAGREHVLHSVVLPRGAVPLFLWPEWLEMFVAHSLRETWRMRLRSECGIKGEVELLSLTFSFLKYHIPQFFQDRVQKGRKRSIK